MNHPEVTQYQNAGSTSRICIVTPDVIGPIKNGGIGTHVHFLARTLVNDGYDVTILFTGPVQVKDSIFWQKYYQDLGISYLDFDLLSDQGYILENHQLINRSHLLLNYFRDHHFDVLHFQEWQANGFHAIQAKRTLGEFSDTLITVMMHSSTQWISEGMRDWNYWPDIDPKSEWCERYCCRHADLLLSPSSYMFNWAQKRGWDLAESRMVIPYSYSPATDINPPGSVNSEHLVFFGRLETRKGLKLFVEALTVARERFGYTPDKISFLGKIGVVDHQPADEFIAANIPGYTYEILSDLDSFQALRYLADSTGVAVIPSLVDNYPFTVLECIVHGLPFIAARTGGISEQADSTVLFDLEPVSCAEKLDGLNHIDFGNLTHIYEYQAANSRWSALHRQSDAPSLVSISPGHTSAIDICLIAGSNNTPDDLDPWLRHLSDTTSLYLAVSPADKDAWSSVIATGSVVLDFEHSTPASQMNAISQKGDAQLLLLAPIGAGPSERSIHTMAEALERSKSDAVTSHFRNAESGGIEQPVGGVIDTAAFENPLGALPCLMKRTVFDQLGGFEERYDAWVPEELLIRLILSGFSYDVLPEELFDYSCPTRTSYMTDTYEQMQSRIAAINSHLPRQMHNFLRSSYVPAITGFNRVLGKLREEMQKNRNNKG